MWWCCGSRGRASCTLPVCKVNVFSPLLLPPLQTQHRQEYAWSATVLRLKKGFDHTHGVSPIAIQKTRYCCILNYSSSHMRSYGIQKNASWSRVHRWKRGRYRSEESLPWRRNYYSAPTDSDLLVIGKTKDTMLYYYTTVTIQDTFIRQILSLDARSNLWLISFHFDASVAPPFLSAQHPLVTICYPLCGL